MGQLSNTTHANKQVSSYTETSAKVRAFGDALVHVRPIDALAGEGTAYSRELAYLMSVISAWAYADEAALASKLRYYGMEGAHIRRITIQNNALLVVTTAYLIQSITGESAVLVFRGTDPGNIITLLTDGQVMQRSFLNTRVHAGFFASVEAVWDEVHVALEDARAGLNLDGREDGLNPLKYLYITGHSLGGAMAVLAAARLCQSDYGLSPLLKGVYTFGQPMVGDRGFAQLCQDAFGDRMFRHVFNHDAVPHLPPKSKLDYAHTGGEYRSRAPDEPFSHVDKASDRRTLGFVAGEVFLNALEARLSPNDAFPGLSIDDHLPDFYMHTCRGALVEHDPVITPHSNLISLAVKRTTQVWSTLRIGDPAAAASSLQRRASEGLSRLLSPRERAESKPRA